MMKRRRPRIPQPNRPVASGATQPGAAAEVNSAGIQAAFAMHQKGELTQAEALYKEILASQPRNFDALQLLATIAAQRENFATAVELFDRALKINPLHASSLYNRGIALRNLKRSEEALDSYDRALRIKPDYAEALCSRGNALRDLKRWEEALDSYDRALGIRPAYAEALLNRGNALRDQRRLDEAVASYDRAIEAQPDNAGAFNNRGSVLRDLMRGEEAVASYDRALRIKPDYAEALSNRGNALLDLKRVPEALESYGRALRINPDYPFLYGTWLQTRMQICDWTDLPRDIAALVDKVSRGGQASPPFPVAVLSSSPALQQKAAEIYMQHKHPLSLALPEVPRRPRRDRIRVGYFSADYRIHPVSLLTAELFETHDRSRFEVTAFSFGPDTRDEVRKRAKAAFENFIDVRNTSDTDVAMLARNLGIDIAVDLGGYTGDSRTGIFALRAAPLQINFLGYPGTMGAQYIDYLIADTTIVPETDKRYYAEKIAYIPSWLPNDSTRRIADKDFTRDALGLPQKGFVFCCFNNHYKITPRTFDGWMRILKEVDQSVLWLSDGNGRAKDNLRKEASLRGIAAERLVFAQRMPMLQDHLARQRSADLFIDTLPCNAGTTASDALWAGLPVLTCVGSAFAGRMAASLLNTIHLPELITSTQEEYEALAIELATNPEKLRQIRQKLEKNRLTTPLFDAKLYTQHIEAAYTQMYERHQAGLPPDHIHVKP
jgi:predicted O-linked N-acetylglucosamine transferase (SPINDLY family)